MDLNLKRVILIPDRDDDPGRALQKGLQLIDAQQARGYQLLEQIFFVRAESRKAYRELYAMIFNTCRQQLSVLPSTAIIAQAPAGGESLCAEFVFASISGEITYHDYKGIPYTRLKSGEHHEVFAAGISPAENATGFFDQTSACFRLLGELLATEGLEIGDIVRQWNYVGQILHCYREGNKDFQHYQVMNDLRGEAYARHSFENGFPAATGIGTLSEGVTLGIHAIRSEGSLRILPVHNPLQTDAYRYSDQVLIGTHKQAPQFERGKLLIRESGCLIYISGTAAIHNEQTLAKNDLYGQVQVTMDNILNLISADNPDMKPVYEQGGQPGINYLRAYIKPGQNMHIVKNYLKEKFHGVDLLLLEADICRDDLLVEIEGIAVANFN